MAYINTGYKYAETLTVSKKNDGGESAPGYPKTYNILSFEGDEDITSADLQLLPKDDYLQRVYRFVMYVRMTEGTDFPISNEPAEYDVESCPV